MSGFRFKQRRGAITVMTALTFFALVACAAVAVDFSRLWTVRNELQSGADAGALAGAMQLIGVRDSLRYADSATTYARRNRTLSDTLHVDSIQKGNWNDPTRTFTPGAGPSNAVNMVVSYRASRLWMSAFGATVPRMRARAIAWAGAGITSAGCMRPWAIPYEALMYALNVYRGISPANSNANLNRPFDQVNDLAALNAMTPAERTFSLKIGSGPVTAPAGGYSGTTMPGNYQAVRLGKYWDYATQSVANPGPDNGGGNVYADHIAGATCHGLAVGDSLETEPGNIVGKTIQGACKNGNIGAYETCNTPAACSFLIGSGPSTGDCLDASGTVGVTIKAAFFSCATSCNGRTRVGVNLLGSFTLTKVYPRTFGVHDKNEIAGEFKPIQSSGSAGGSSTTLQRLVLAK